MTIRISAVLCTRNRARYLRRAIESLVGQSMPDDRYEIIVVDNASEDETSQVVQEEFREIRNLRYIYEPIRGLSQARNAALEDARGEYIAYLDDDAVASTQWLAKILNVFDTVKPTPGCVGGRIDLIWERPRPAWMPERLLDGYGRIDWSEKPMFLGDEQYIGGGNSAYVRRLLREVGGFSTRLGRKPNSLLSNEEILLRRQLETLGHRCYYDPDIRIQHHVLASRITKRFLLRRGFWQGVSRAITDAHLKAWSPRDRRWLARVAAFGFVRSRRHLGNLVARPTEGQRLMEVYDTWFEVGRILGLAGIRR